MAEDADGCPACHEARVAGILRASLQQTVQCETPIGLSQLFDPLNIMVPRGHTSSGTCTVSTVLMPSSFAKRR